MQHLGSSVALPIEDGAVATILQDQTTPSVDVLFTQSITGSDFTLSQATASSTLTTLEYTLNVVAGHGVVTGNCLQMLDVIADRAFFPCAVATTATTITVDRPIDHAFPVTSICRRVVTNMNVDGSSTKQIFTVRAGANPIDFIRYNLIMTHGSAGDDAKFGSIPALTNGLVMRIVNGYQRTFACFKTNADIKEYCGPPDLVYGDKAGGGPGAAHSTGARITYGGPSKHGIVHRVSGSSAIQVIVQDDLTDLGSLKVRAQGHENN